MIFCTCFLVMFYVYGCTNQHFLVLMSRALRFIFWGYFSGNVVLRVLRDAILQKYRPFLSGLAMVFRDTVRWPIGPLNQMSQLAQ